MEGNEFLLKTKEDDILEIQKSKFFLFEKSRCEKTQKIYHMLIML